MATKLGYVHIDNIHRQLISLYNQLDDLLICDFSEYYNINQWHDDMLKLESKIEALLVIEAMAS